MLESQAEEYVFHTNQRGALSPVQRSAFQDIASKSMDNALNVFCPNSTLRHYCTTKLSLLQVWHLLTRRVDRNIEDKTLQGECIDLALPLQDNLFKFHLCFFGSFQQHTLSLQLWGKWLFQILPHESPPRSRRGCTTHLQGDTFILPPISLEWCHSTV